MKNKNIKLCGNSRACAAARQSEEEEGRNANGAGETRLYLERKKAWEKFKVGRVAERGGRRENALIGDKN